MDNPLISIIVPVYKVEAYLRKCVDSILAQTYTNIEAILVDDGSPDGCPAICDEYAAKDRRVVVIHQRNAGVSVARNAGLNAAKGEYVGFVDSDDWIEPDTVKVQYHVVRSTGVDMAASYTCLGDGHPEKVGADAAVVMSPNEAMRRLLENQYDLIAVWGKLFARHLVEGMRFSSDLAMAEDTLFIVQAIARSRSVAYVPYHCYHYSVRDDSATHLYGENVWTVLDATDRIVAAVRRFDRGLGPQAEKWALSLDVRVAKETEAAGRLSRKACGKIVDHVRSHSGGESLKLLSRRERCWILLLLMGSTPFLVGRGIFRMMMKVRCRKTTNCPFWMERRPG